MRKLLLALTGMFFLVLFGAAAALFFARDRLLLEEARRQLSQLEPLKIELGTLHTSLLGPLEITIGGVKANRDATTLELRELKLRSPLTLFGLYKAYSTGGELPLDIALMGARVTLPPQGASPTAKENSAAQPWPVSLAPASLSPLPLRLEIRIVESELRGRFAANNIQGKVELVAGKEAFEAKTSLKLLASLPGAQAALPAAFELKVAGTRKLVKVQSFQFTAAGLNATGSGELGLEPVSAKMKVSADAGDLSRLALRPEDRAALGLAAQPAGAFSLKAELGVSKEGSLSASGTLGLTKVALPLELPGKSVFSGLLEGTRAEGDAALSAELPLTLETRWPFATNPYNLSGRANASLDLTECTIEKKGVLKKAKGIPLSAELQASMSEKGAVVQSLSARFHTLSLSGSGELPAPLGKVIGATFKAQAPSLAGFPELLPSLSEAQSTGASLTEAQGSVATEGKLRFLVDKPAQSVVELKALSLKGIRLPVNFKNESLQAKGLLLANVSGAGKYDAGALDVAQSSGNADLTGMSLNFPGKLEKKKGRKLLLAFEARGNPAKLVVKQASINADGLSAGLSGTIISSTKGKIQLDLNASANAELNSLREYLPKLPLKISGGSLGAKAKVGGAWLTEGGVELSPLLISGTMIGKLGSVEIPPAAESEAETTLPAQALLPNWPVARKAKLGFVFDLGQFTRGPLQASGIHAQGNLNEGRFTGEAIVSRVFGGKASLRQLAGDLREAKVPVRGLALVEGMDLSSMAGFVDPSYQKIVKGTLKADASFQAPDVLGNGLLQTAMANGKAEIRNGYVSTASLDTLVNAKLSAIPGIGDKAKLNSGGMAAEMRTNFSVAGGVATLKDFVAITPKKDEMRLAGTMNLAFDCDLAGEAALANAPVQGAVREANSDALGRLVIPIRFRGNLKNPSVDIASETIQAMLAKTAKQEASKLKDKAVSEGKKKLEDEAKKAVGELLKGF